MAAWLFPLAVCLAFTASGCATVNEERLVRLELAVEDIQAQEMRLATLEDVVNSIVAKQRVATKEIPSAQTKNAAPPESADGVTRVVSAAPGAAMSQDTPVGGMGKDKKNNSPVPQTPKMAIQGEKQYKTALVTLESGRPQEAMPLFAGFLREYPGHALAPNAEYWFGECHYSLKQYDLALAAFKDVVAQFPQHDKAAASMLKAGYSYMQLGDMANARFYLEALIRDFPSSAPASLARLRLGHASK